MLSILFFGRHLKNIVANLKSGSGTSVGPIVVTPQSQFYKNSRAIVPLRAADRPVNSVQIK